MHTKVDLKRDHVIDYEASADSLRVTWVALLAR